MLILTQVKIEEMRKIQEHKNEIIKLNNDISELKKKNDNIRNCCELFWKTNFRRS